MALSAENRLYRAFKVCCIKNAIDESDLL